MKSRCSLLGRRQGVVIGNPLALPGSSFTLSPPETSLAFNERQHAGKIAASTEQGAR